MSKEGEKEFLFEHDIVFWCGDLNYRIDNENFEEVVEMI